MSKTYEPTWQCRLCGSEGLLAESHRHCANCGHARDEEIVTFPGWDDLVPAALHRFHGAAFHCCGRGWSCDARHCGVCGEDLVSAAPFPLAVTSWSGPPTVIQAK